MTHIANAEETRLVRLTIVDRTKVVSLAGDVLLARQMVAACAANPNNLEELLMATEPLRPGITRQVVNGLLEFDRRRRQDWMVRLDPLKDIFEAEDAHLEKLSRTELPGGMVRFKLAHRVIKFCGSSFSAPNEVIRGEAELPVWENDQLSRKTVTYSLDDLWKIVNLDDPAGAGSQGSEMQNHQPISTVAY